MLYRSAYGEVTWMLVFPNFPTPHMVALIISFCLSVVVFIVSQISKKSKPQVTLPSQIFPLQYHTNIHVDSVYSDFCHSSEWSHRWTDPLSGLAQGWVGMSPYFSNICEKIQDWGLLDFIPVSGQVSL